MMPFTLWVLYSIDIILITFAGILIVSYNNTKDDN